MGIVCDEKKKKIIRENMQLSHSVSISYEDLRHIESQKKTCVFKITTDSINGTGFFGLIRFPNQKMIKALFTCHHNLVSENSKEIQKSFQYSIGINEKFIKMEINDSRFVYQNKEYDIVIIEILESDKIEINSFLEIDDLIYEEDKKYEEFVLIINKKDDRDDIIKNILHLKEMKISIYLLHYPKLELLCESTGIITNFNDIKKYQIRHKCSSESGSSGGPIMNLNNYKVLAIHTGAEKKINSNLGTFLRNPIKEFIQQYQDSKRNNFLTEEIYQQLKYELKIKKEKIKSSLKEKKIKTKYELKEDYDEKNFHSDIITLKYKIDKENKMLKLFNKEFVERNKDIKIIIKGETKNIVDEIEIDKYITIDKNLEIYLKDLNKIKTMSKMFSGCNTLISLVDIYRWDTTNVLDMSFAFEDCALLTEFPDISKWNTENIVDMGGMFKGCESLLSLPDISKWNTSNAINFGQMFSGCNQLESLPDLSKWNMSKSININKMFSECKNLQIIPDISEWNMSNVEDMSYLFFRCENLFSLPNNLGKWNTTKVNKIDYLFGGLYRLKNLPNISDWDTSNVVDMQSLFINCRLLSHLSDISKWNTTNVKNMSSLFAGCRNLNYLPDISKWKTSNVEDMKYMFFENECLVSLPDISKWNTKKVKRMNSMFESSFQLYSLPDISKWDISNVLDLRNMFSGCLALQELPNISRWNTENVRLMTQMFALCFQLTYLPNIGNWDTSNLQDFRAMFYGCNPNLKIPSKFISFEPIYIDHKPKDIFNLDDDL